MRKNKFTDTDIDTIASAMKWVYSNVTHETDIIYSKPPAQKVIACVLSLGTNYERVVSKRLRQFEENHPDVNSITELEKLIARYSTPYDFFVKELDHKKELKASAINELVKFFHRTIRKTPRKKVSKIEAVYLMEESASHAGISTRLIDHSIWRMKTKWKSVLIAPDVYDDFGNQISINKVLQSSRKGN